MAYRLRVRAKVFYPKGLLAVLGSLVALYAFIVPVSGVQVSTRNQDVISQARDAYYSLATRGVRSFKASIEPKWEVILGHSATPENLKVFRALRFSMTFDANGKVRLSHEVTAKINPRLESSVVQIHDNMQRLVEGFFATWAMFVVGSPFPETGVSSRVETSGVEYRIFNTLQSGDVMFTMTMSDFVIRDWRFTGPRGKRVVKPLFHKAADGLLLSGYQSTFESPSGIKTTLEFHIEYRDVSGLKLPHKILMSGMYASEPVEAELIFNRYVLNPH